MQFKIGTLQVPAGPAPVAVPVTGLGFTPQVVRFYCTSVDLAQTIIPSDVLIISRGAMTSLGEQYAINGYILPGTTAACLNSKRTSKCLVIYDGSSTLVDAEFVSMDADGFTINFTNTDSVPRDICWQAFEGVRASKISEVLLPNASLSPVYQDLDIAWDMGLVNSVGSDSAGNLDDVGFVDGLESAIGSTGDAGTKGITYGSQTFSVTSSLCGSGTRNIILRFIRGVTPSFLGTAAFGGTNLAIQPQPTTSFDYYLSTLAMAGVTCFSQQIAIPTTASEVSYTQAGFRPIGVLLFGTASAAAPGVQTVTRVAHGFTDGTNHFAAWSRAQRATVLGVLATRTFQYVTNAVTYHTEADPVGGGGINVEGTVTSFLSNGFKINWTTVGATASAVLAFSFKGRDVANGASGLLVSGRT